MGQNIEWFASNIKGGMVKRITLPQQLYPTVENFHTNDMDIALVGDSIVINLKKTFDGSICIGNSSYSSGRNVIAIGNNNKVVGSNLLIMCNNIEKYGNDQYILDPTVTVIDSHTHD